VHLLAAEREAASRTPRRGVAHERYRPRQWKTVRDWRTYAPDGEPWLGFEAVRALDGLPPEILLIPLRGHTLGHAGVAVETPSGWLLHAGDAYLHRAALDLERPNMPWGMAAYERVMDTDRTARRLNQKRLRALKADAAAGVSIFCAHDAEELAGLQAATA
jgi:glyoxylase-like metal-dependent hydrolase (beta-lactamase superfamily II)